MPRDTPLPKDYLGDGVYAQQSDWGGSIILTTENGISVDNHIELEHATLAALIRYLKRAEMLPQ